MILWINPNIPEKKECPHAHNLTNRHLQTAEVFNSAQASVQLALACVSVTKAEGPCYPTPAPSAPVAGVCVWEGGYGGGRPVHIVFLQAYLCSIESYCVTILVFRKQNQIFCRPLNRDRWNFSLKPIIIILTQSQLCIKSCIRLNVTWPGQISHSNWKEK